MKFAVDNNGTVMSAPGEPAANVDTLGVFKAMNALSDTLRKTIGIGDEHGPLPVYLVMKAGDFAKLEIAMRGADEFSAGFFAPRTCGGRRRAADQTMIAGITILAADA